ncbi:glycosyltransferase family 87 protein [Hyphococcus flavus]|uniref:Glycosyltransferase family 87 protein n=1 Tax=Hyphococcus flavus TaxID=1866326 RepID=A0AAF0CGT2_9PROT|nr:glycosyltransferase family 87 protein [Hyphococcus flavus]WDI32849.1 glycosyltransferase family 87 protein [Hyphococcus flavus]
MSAKTFTSLLQTADIRLNARHIRLGASALGATLIAVIIAQFALSNNLVTPLGTPVGGDFAAFWTAAKALAAGDGASIYYAPVFHDWLARIAPPQESWGLSWQYPPTYYFAVAFLALLPYWLGYAVWTGGGLAIFAASTRSAGVTGLALLAALATPAVFQTVITGQNGFLTAGLLIGATLFVDKRPVLAGICAALLTMKPQLGLLLPVAYIAGGHWRAFITAGAGAMLLAGASVAAFGFETWDAFIDSLRTVDKHIRDGLMPLYKMPTIYATVLMAGAPLLVAQILHGIGALCAGAATFIIWWRSNDKALKSAVVCCGAFMVAPYAYYYELTIMVAPFALLALQSARSNDWRPFDQLMLLALFLIPLILPGEPQRTGFNLSVVMTLLAFGFVLRRMTPAPHKQ